MSANVIILLCMVGIYPALVLLVALTGPHHPVEIAEYKRLKAARRTREAQ
jgi:hypothetical protein